MCLQHEDIFACPRQQHRGDQPGEPGTDHRADTDLIILYTGSYEVDAHGADVGPLGTVAMLIGAGGRREIWRFRDAPEANIDLSAGRPMKT